MKEIELEIHSAQLTNVNITHSLQTLEIYFVFMSVK